MKIQIVFIPNIIMLFQINSLLYKQKNKSKTYIQTKILSVIQQSNNKEKMQNQLQFDLQELNTDLNTDLTFEDFVLAKKQSKEQIMQKEEIHKQIQYKCIQQNQALQFCINQECTCNSSFICSAKRCSCRSKHSFCQKGDVLYTLQAIRAKVNRTNQIKSKIRKVIDDTVDALSILQDKLQSKIDHTLKYIELDQVEKQFYLLSSSKDNKEKYSFKSQQLSTIWSLASLKENQPQYNSFNNQIMNKINSLKQLVLNIYKDTSTQIDQIIEKFKDNKQKIIRKNIILSKETKMKKFNMNLQILKSHVTSESCFYQSQILRNQEDVQNLKNFFTKEIKKASLKFRASQHEFNLDKYYKLCQSNKNGLIITKNDKKKIVGSYVPFCFISKTDQTEDYIEFKDPSNTAFAFSIDLNQKFGINANKVAMKAYKRNVDYTYYTRALHISPKWTVGFLLANDEYNTSKYPSSKESYLKLTGYQSNQWIKLVQLQAYELQFQK